MLTVAAAAGFVAKALFDPGQIPEKFGYSCAQQGMGTNYRCWPTGHPDAPHPPPKPNPQRKPVSHKPPSRTDGISLGRAVELLRGALKSAEQAERSGDDRDATIAQLKTEEAAREIAAAKRESMLYVR